MKAVFVTGSARKGGSTDTLCDIVSDILKKNGSDVDIFRAYDMKIAHCTNCGGCEKTGICTINDDMKKIYDAFRAADIIVLCTPVHFSDVSSILKQVIDRLQCVWRKPYTSNKKILGVIACGGSDRPCFKNIVSVSKAVSNTIGAEWVGELTVSESDKGLTDEQKEKANSFAKMLLKFKNARPFQDLTQ